MDQLTPATRNAIAIGVIVGLLAHRIIRGRGLGMPNILGDSSAEMLTARRSDKATSIIEWFGNVSIPSYTKYKDAFAEPNIVEYEDMLALHQAGNLTQKTAEERLR
jgi:hypothetical protein